MSRVAEIRRCALAIFASGAAAAFAQGIEPPPGAESAAFVKATADFVAGNYDACRTGFAAVSRAAPRAGLSARAAYGAACCAAQAGDTERAFQELALAVANGFSDTARTLTDPRLEPLYGDKRWLAILKKIDEVRMMRELGLEPTLLNLYRELEAARRNPAAPDPGQAAKRRATALELVDKGRLKEPEDHFHAAALLAESDDRGEVGRARNLALRALELNPDLLAARPLYATALDRELALLGKPQKFGTQSILKDGAWVLHEVDPAVTDADRKAWGVPPLAELRAHLADLPKPEN